MLASSSSSSSSSWTMTGSFTAMATTIVVVAVGGGILLWKKKEKSAIVSKPPKDSLYKAIVASNGRSIKIRYTDTDDSKSKNKETEEESGTTTIVLVHGFMGCLETWNLVKKQLLSSSSLTTKNFRIIALDLPGDGFSDKPLGGNNDDDGMEYTFRNQGQLLAQFLQDMGLLLQEKQSTKNQLILVGHSAGGIVVTAAASKLQRDSIPSTNTTIGLFLVAPGLFSEKPIISSRWIGKFMVWMMRKMRFVMLQKAHLHHPIPQEIYQAFEATYYSPNAAQALEQFIMTSEDPYIQVLSDINNNNNNDTTPSDATIPIHFVWSKEDFINPVAVDKLEALQQEGTMNVPSYTYTIISDSGHYIQHDQPEQLTNELLKFINQ